MRKAGIKLPDDPGDGWRTQGTGQNLDGWHGLTPEQEYEQFHKETPKDRSSAVPAGFGDEDYR